MKKTPNLVVVLLSILSTYALLTSASATAPSIMITGQDPGPTAFISLLRMTANQPSAVRSIRFTISPKPGSVTRPLSATYTRKYLQSRGYFNSATGAITVPVFGLYANSDNNVGLTYFFTDGSAQQDSALIHAPDWTDDCNRFKAPVIVQPRTNSTALTYDYILLKSNCSVNSPVIIDSDGQVRWIGSGNIKDIISTFFNNGIYIGSGTVLKRIELDGTFHTLANYSSIRSLHHNLDFGRTGILVEANTTAQEESLIMEVDAAGNIIKTWDFAQIISDAMTAGGDDPTQFVKPASDPQNDWFHNNAATYRKSDNTLVVSSRENFVIGIDYDTNQIKWILGDPGKQWYQFPSLNKFALTVPLPPGGDPNDLPYPIGQHAVSFTHDDNLLLFDDGYFSLHHTPAGRSRDYSAPRKYELNLARKRATEVWTYLNTPSIYSRIISSVYEDRPFNYLIDYAFADSGQDADLMGLSANGEKVFEYKYPNVSGTLAAWNALPLHFERLSFTAPNDVLPGLRDINSDGKDDLLWQNIDTHEVNTWIMDGAGQKVRSQTIRVANKDFWKIVCMTDINDDGLPDLLWENGANHEVRAWILNGNGKMLLSMTIGPAQTVDNGWRLMGATDVNQDGIPDLVWQNLTTYEVVAWLMDGAGHETSVMTIRASLSTDDGWRVAGTGDINHDGIGDILWQNNMTYQVLAWVMDGAGHELREITIRPARATDDGWKVVGAADINHDGIDDVLWQNTINHSAVAWIMDGAGVRTSSITLRSYPEAGSWRLNGRLP